MMRRWVLFARDGNPNGTDKDKVSPTWPAYHKSDDKHLEFGNKVTVGEKLDRELCDLVEKVAARREKK